MKDSMDRRQFLGNTARTAAVGAAATMATSAMAQSENSSQEEVVVGVMGLSRGRALAERFARHSGVTIKYVCDVDETRAASAAKSVAGIAKTAPQPVGDFRKILDDAEVDALICAAPNHWHGPATILACSAGKHVYVEKPCSHNPWEGEMMIEAARKNRCAVQVGTQRRSGPKFREIIAELQDGIIGRVYHSRSWYANIRGPIGVGKPEPVPSNIDFELWQGPAPRTPWMSNRVHYNWHWFWQWGNGELGNNGVHTLDVARWGLGVDYPIRVTSSGGRYRYEDDQQTPDTHIANFDFDDRKSISWQGLSCNRHKMPFVVFYGEKGTAELDANGGYVIYDERDKEIKKETGDRGDDAHVENFLTAIRTDSPLSLNAEIAEGHKSTLLCHLGNIAHRVGRLVNCDPTNGHVVGDDEAAALWKRDYEPGWEPKV